jgi:AcrR family transcriptional regulator
MADNAPAPEPDPSARRILQAAALRFAAEGFERTRLADIARDAGLAVGTVYLRYDGKTALLAAVLSQAEDRYAAAMDTPAIWATPWPARFRAVFEAVFRMVTEDTLGQRLMPLAPFAQAAGWRQGDGIRPVIRRHIAQGQAAGMLRTDIDLAMAAAIAFGMVEGAMSEVMAQTTAPAGTAVDHLVGAAEAWLCRRP